MTTKKPTWQDILGPEEKQDYFQAILSGVSTYQNQGVNVYPPKDQIFQAFQATPFTEVKVVILGQDPYHGPNQAHGLSFSVPHGIQAPPSLKNIFKAIEFDLGITPPNHGCLTPWASQGVLLLNSVLTVSRGKPQSHSSLGWQTFTDTVIRALNQHAEATVFLLWGAYAQKKSALLTNPQHLVLKAVHPSPLSAHRGFLTCKHFSRANAWLTQHGRHPVDWALDGLPSESL
jgi:uracil-DNA glycosylase